jgi:CMP-N,N'-diacetyllegionaminic acid synthase
MNNSKKMLAIIPARKGSKRLPHKNRILLSGKPLIAWTIEPAVQSEFIDTVIVSTDDELIIGIGKQYGAKVPFIRPADIAEDTTVTYDVIIHAINFYKEKDIIFDYVILLQPTSPLRTLEDINNAIKLIDENTKAVISVCKAEHSPIWSNILPSDFSMKNFLEPNLRNLRSQDLPIYYRLNGAIYVAKIDYLLENEGFFGSNTTAYIMDQKRSVDIDTKIDYELCKLLLNENN